MGPARAGGRDRHGPPREDPAVGEVNPADEARWTHLANAAFHLQQTEGEPREARLRAARLSLQSALEAFQSAEPLDDLPGFAVRRLLLAVEGALEDEAGAGTQERPLAIPPHLTPRR